MRFGATWKSLRAAFRAMMRASGRAGYGLTELQRRCWASSAAFIQSAHWYALLRASSALLSVSSHASEFWLPSSCLLARATAISALLGSEFSASFLCSGHQMYNEDERETSAWSAVLLAIRHWQGVAIMKGVRIDRVPRCNRGCKCHVSHHHVWHLPVYDCLRGIDPSGDCCRKPCALHWQADVRSPDTRNTPGFRSGRPMVLALLAFLLVAVYFFLGG